MNQRIMMQDAARIAGFNTLALVHENIAAATRYGIDRNEKVNETHNAVFYNMGSRDIEVLVARYSGFETPDNKTYEKIDVSSKSEPRFLLRLMKKI
jgi:hypothetical protein